LSGTKYVSIDGIKRIECTLGCLFGWGVIGGWFCFQTSDRCLSGFGPRFEGFWVWGLGHRSGFGTRFEGFWVWGLGHRSGFGTRFVGLGHLSGFGPRFVGLGHRSVHHWQFGRLEIRFSLDSAGRPCHNFCTALRQISYGLFVVLEIRVEGLPNAVL